MVVHPMTAASAQVVESGCVARVTVLPAITLTALSFTARVYGQLLQLLVPSVGVHVLLVLQSPSVES